MKRVAPRTPINAARTTLEKEQGNRRPFGLEIFMMPNLSTFKTDLVGFHKCTANWW
jgi:hypothetical protein